MAQITDGWRRIFSVPQVYRAAQATIGSPNVRRTLVDEYARPRTGERVLDIGCGTGDLTEYLGDVQYHGFDPSADYVEAARAKYGSQGEFEVAGVGEASFADDAFDLCLAKGVLHHLDDDVALALFRDARRALVPGGRLVTIDPVFDEDQSTIARRLAERDRGQNVRSADGYRQLAEQVFDDVDVVVRHDLLRVPYSHAVLMATAS